MKLIVAHQNMRKFQIRRSRLKSYLRRGDSSTAPTRMNKEMRGENEARMMKRHTTDLVVGCGVESVLFRDKDNLFGPCRVI